MGFLFYLYLFTYVVVLVNEIYCLIYNKIDNYFWNYINILSKNKEISTETKRKLIYTVVKENYGIIGVLYPNIYFIWLLTGFMNGMWLFHIFLFSLNVVVRQITKSIVDRIGFYDASYHFVVKLFYLLIILIIGIYFFNYSFSLSLNYLPSINFN